MRVVLTEQWECNPAQLALVSSDSGGGDGSEHGACAVLTRAAGVERAGPCQLDLCFEHIVRIQALRVKSSARMLEVYALDPHSNDADPFNYVSTERGTRDAAPAAAAAGMAAGTAIGPPRFSVETKVLRGSGGTGVMTSVLRLRFLSLQGGSKDALSLWFVHVDSAPEPAAAAGGGSTIPTSALPGGAQAGGLAAPPGAHQMITMLMRGMGSLATARPSSRSSSGPSSGPKAAPPPGRVDAAVSGASCEQDRQEDRELRAAKSVQPSASAETGADTAAAMDKMKAEILASVQVMVHKNVKAMGDTMARIFERRLGAIEDRLSRMEQQMAEVATVSHDPPSIEHT